MNRTKWLGEHIVGCELYTNVLGVWLQCNKDYNILAIELEKSLNCEANKSVDWLKLAKGLV